MDELMRVVSELGWAFIIAPMALPRQVKLVLLIGAPLAFVLCALIIILRYLREEGALKLSVESLIVLFATLLSAELLTPATFIAVNHILARLMKRPLENVALEVVLQVFLGWFAALIAIAITVWVKCKPASPEQPSSEIADFQSYITIEAPDDLLQLDQSRFLENGFGGLYPRRKRRT